MNNLLNSAISTNFDLVTPYNVWIVLSPAHFLNTTSTQL